MIHAPHPKCAECGKALFKAFDGPWNGNPPPKVTKAMPYVFCRNVKHCNEARVQSAGTGRALETLKKNVKTMVKEVKSKPVYKKYTKQTLVRSPELVSDPPPIPPVTRKTEDGKTVALKRKAIPKGPPKPPKPVDSDVVAVARTRVAALIKAFGNEIGLVLALANQELGNNDVANALIDEYSLNERFGLEKF
jgi:hypothetical protein